MDKRKCSHGSYQGFLVESLTATLTGSGASLGDSLLGFSHFVSQIKRITGCVIVFMALSK